MYATETRTNSAVLQLLLVEDAKIVRMGLKLALEGYGDMQIVAEAGSCEEALLNVQVHRPDVVLLDLSMPDGSAFDLLRQIHQLDSTIKVMALGSHENREEVLGSLNAGAHAYCLKNIQAEDLASAVRLVNQGGIWLDPGVSLFVRNYFQDAAQRVTPGPALVPADVIKPRLTRREREVLGLLIEGQNNQQIALNLNISIHTVKAAIRNILRKSQSQDRVHLAVRAIKEQFV
jgi:DNA-binding NarL/FixJ family response regulator